MAQKIKVQDGVVLYSTTDGSELNFTIEGNLTANISTANTAVYGNSTQPGGITSGQYYDTVLGHIVYEDLYISPGYNGPITGAAGGNLFLQTNANGSTGYLILNNYVWPNQTSANQQGYYLGTQQGTSMLEFYQFYLGTVGSDTLTNTQLNTMFPNAQIGQGVVGITVIYECVAANTWLTLQSTSGGTVTSVGVSGGTTGLTTTGGPITSSGTITFGGVLSLTNGGTGQTTANASFNALAPSQTSNAGFFLTTDGTNTSWSQITNAGLQNSSVTISVGTGLVGGGTVALGGTVPINIVSPSTSTLNVSSSINTVETYISNNSFTIQQFIPGESYRVIIYGTCTTSNADTSTFNLRLGTNGDLTDTIIYTTSLTSSGAGGNVPFKIEFICTFIQPSSTIIAMVAGSYLNSASTAGISTHTAGVFAPANSSTITPGIDVLGVSFLTSAATTSVVFQNVIVETIR